MNFWLWREVVAQVVRLSQRVSSCTSAIYCKDNLARLSIQWLESLDPLTVVSVPTHWLALGWGPLTWAAVGSGARMFLTGWPVLCFQLFFLFTPHRSVLDRYATLSETGSVSFSGINFLNVFNTAESRHRLSSQAAQHQCGDSLWKGPERRRSSSRAGCMEPRLQDQRCGELPPQLFTPGDPRCAVLVFSRLCVCV